MHLTEILAVYAALLSTGVFLWNIHKARSRVRVRLTHAIEKINEEYVSGVIITVQNPSTHRVHITNVSILYPFRKRHTYALLEDVWRFRHWPRHSGWCHSSLSNYDITDNCPVSLEPGASHNIFIPQDVLEKVLEEAVARSLKAVAQDALWRNSYSRSFNYPAGSSA